MSAKRDNTKAEVVQGEVMDDDEVGGDEGGPIPIPEERAVLTPQEAKRQLMQQTLSEAQIDFLMQRTPKREIKYRQGRGGLQFAYVEHGYVTERLNLVFGWNWDFEIVSREQLEDEVIVEARLTVRTPGGQTIIKTQFGGADIKRFDGGPRKGNPLSIADDYKAAASDAIKKCASLLGIGLDLYGRDRDDYGEAEAGNAGEGYLNPDDRAAADARSDRAPRRSQPREPREARGEARQPRQQDAPNPERDELIAALHAKKIMDRMRQQGQTAGLDDAAINDKVATIIELDYGNKGPFDKLTMDEQEGVGRTFWGSVKDAVMEKQNKGRGQPVGV